MAPPSGIEPGGPWLSKTPSFTGVGARLISKCRCGCHGWVGVGWQMHKISVNSATARIGGDRANGGIQDNGQELNPTRVWVLGGGDSDS